MGVSRVHPVSQLDVHEKGRSTARRWVFLLVLDARVDAHEEARSTARIWMFLVDIT